MTTKQQLTLAWTVALILAILLVISLVFQVKGSSQGNLSATADKIRMDCSKTDAASKTACGTDLQQLSDILRNFSSDIDKSATTTAG